MADTIVINRAPVLTLWASVVAERLGYDHGAALTLGRALAGLNAQSKGRRLGIYQPSEEKRKVPKRAKPGETAAVELMGRQVPVIGAEEGIRAAEDGAAIHPNQVERYLKGKFGDDLDRAREAMEALARSFKPEVLADAAFSLYEQFRPEIPSGARGWGAKGELDLDYIRSLAK